MQSANIETKVMHWASKPSLDGYVARSKNRKFTRLFRLPIIEDHPNAEDINAVIAPVLHALHANPFTSTNRMNAREVSFIAQNCPTNV